MAVREARHTRWMGGAAALGGMLGLAGLAACSGGQAKNASNMQTASGAAMASAMPMAGGAPTTAAANADPAAPAAVADGAQLYRRCATCHQPNGKGMAGAFPPLAGSEWATAKDAAVPIRIVLHGLNGPITVARQRYNSAMPAYGTNQPMDDSAVAAVLTYVRTSWGNAAAAITPAEVAAQRTATASRKTPWTAAELQPLLAPPSH